MRLFVGVVVVAIIQNVVDWLLNAFFLKSYYAAVPRGFFLEGVHPLKPIIADILLALFLAFLYDRVSSAFSGITGGLTFGFLTGLLVYVPHNLLVLYYVSAYPPAIPWTWMIGGIITFLINGLALALIWQYVKQKTPG
ncbi:MAG: hypothetical protein V2G48_02610 [bacterium JZ-2024 1]